MSEIEQLLENVSKDIFQRFHKIYKINFFHIMNPLENVLAVNIIFKTKKDLKKFQKNTTGIQNTLMDYLYETLEATGRWKLREIDLQIEMDSEKAQKESVNKGKNNIPSEEDFLRADAADTFRNRGLSEVREQILKRFKMDELHELFLFYSSNTDTFGAYIFYRWERQIKEAEKSGLSSRIKDAVFAELGRVGRGSKDTINVNFEFDSHENVEKNYEGDYYLRLR